MSFKNLFKALTLCACLTALTVVSFGQETVSGVILMREGGTSFVPVEGAKVICFRTDIEGKCGTVVTAKDGKFQFSNLPKEAKVGLGLSGPNLAATYYSEFSVTEKRAKKLYVLVNEGDGQEAPDDQLLSNIRGDGLSDEDKSNRTKSELENQRRFEGVFDVTARNKLREKLMKEGNAAFNKGDFDGAVEKYNQGYETDPKFLGSAPGFLNNKSIALRKRAVDVYNKAVKTKNSQTIVKAKADVIPDMLLSLESAIKAYDLITESASLDSANAKLNENNLKSSESSIKETFRVLSQMSLPLPANTEEEADRSIGVYMKTLKLIPDDLDVLSGLMIAYYNAGAFTGDEKKYQLSLDYGAYYLQKASSGHSKHAAVTQLVESLKTDNKLSPKPIK